ncbi:MAG: MtnX-like HAD-IB family phosphatase [Clostridiales bacterium]
MKNFIFISDFDGTLTRTDFFQVLIDNHLKEKAMPSYIKWREGKIPVFDFLNIVFTSINCTEAEIYEDIKEIIFDDSSLDLMKRVTENNGDFVILSAGSSYYIEKLLEYKKIKGIRVISNKGIYKDGGIHMQPDKNSPFFSKISGVDKAKVVKNFKNQYKKIFYAGDGEPDYKAAIQADLIFARIDLKDMLLKRKIDFIDFDNFTEIKDHLTSIGVI